MKFLKFFVRQLGRIVTAVTAVALVSHSAFAAQFPEKGSVITLIVPFGAGGQVDVMGRAMASYWDAKWGTRTIVLNKPGVGGQIALSELLRQKSDGRTIAFTQGFDAQMTYMNPEANAPYSRSSLIPVGLSQNTPSVWVVKNDSPYRTMKDFLDNAKNKPGTMNSGSPSSRSSSIMVLDEFDKKFGAKINNVPFNDAPSMINALMGGHLDIAVSNPAVVLPHLKSGRLRALMAIGDKPVNFFPEASTSASLGIEALNWGSNTGLTLAHGTPVTIVQAWSAMLKDVAADPNLREKMGSMGINLEYSTPEEYAALWTATEVEVGKFLMRSYGKVRPIK